MEYGLSRRTLLVAAAGAALPGGHTVRSSAPVADTWRGSYRLPGRAEPVALSLSLAGPAMLSLGPGHISLLRPRLERRGARVRFTVPGRPAPLLFDGTVHGGRLEGTVRQGSAQGRFALRPGGPIDARAVGSYRLPSGETVAVVVLGGGFYAVAYERSEIRRLYRIGPAAWDVGAGVELRSPSPGTARLHGAGLRYLDARGVRSTGRQLEVRFPARGTTLAGTLELPPGPGPSAAVALVHGSGPTDRTDVAVLGRFLASRGLAVLAYDKRGIGQSGGAYPGEQATAASVDAYAADASAALAFLAAQPEVDPARTGLAGVSQAGWIVPLAAARDPAIRFLLLLSGPTVTVGESDVWAGLTDQGASPFDRAAAEAQLRRLGPSGFDPLPSIRRVQIPGLWIYGGLDAHVPSFLCVERLQPLTREPGRDLQLVLLPRGNHGLIDSDTGLQADAARSPRFASGLYPAIDAWLDRHGLR
jgi:uncharacterized protein